MTEYHESLLIESNKLWNPKNPLHFKNETQKLL